MVDVHCGALPALAPQLFLVGLVDGLLNDLVQVLDLGSQFQIYALQLFNLETAVRFLRLTLFRLAFGRIENATGGIALRLRSLTPLTPSLKRIPVTTANRPNWVASETNQ